MAVKRKIYFYGEEGRGAFNEIEDKQEKIVEFKKYYRKYMSHSIALKSNSSEEFIYFLNFENYDGNVELIDIKTGKIAIDNLFDVFWEFYFEFIQNSQIQVIEWNEKSQFLIAAYASDIYYEDDIYFILNCYFR